MPGLYDNVELDEICAVSAEWEDKWFGGPSSGKPLSDMSAGGGLSSAERETRALVVNECVAGCRRRKA